MKRKVAWWEYPVMAVFVGITLAFALWAQYDTASRKPSGFIPSQYSEQDVNDVRIAAGAILDCWLAQEGADCFSDGLDVESPFIWDMFNGFNDVLTYHQIGQPYEVDTKALGTLMGMDWPEEERRDFANSRDFRRDGMAIVLITSVDLMSLEHYWQARLCGGCALPYSKHQKMAEVRTVIEPAHGLPGASIALYLMATETGWLLFDWQAS